MGMHAEEQELREVEQFVKSRQYYQRDPQPIANVLSRLLSRKAYTQVQSADQREAAWRDIVGPDLAAHSRVGRVQRGVLQIVVRNSALMQELSFRKKNLVKRMMAKLPELKIRDLRFHVGDVD